MGLGSQVWGAIRSIAEGLQTGSREGRRIQRGFWWVPTSFSHMKKTGVTYKAYATN